MAIPHSLSAQRLRTWLLAVRRRVQVWVVTAALVTFAFAVLLLVALVLVRPDWFLPGIYGVLGGVLMAAGAVAFVSWRYLVRRVGDPLRLIDEVGCAGGLQPALYTALHLAHFGPVSGSAEAAELAIEQAQLPAAAQLPLGDLIGPPKRVLVAAVMLSLPLALYVVPTWRARGSDVLASLSAAPPAPALVSS